METGNKNKSGAVEIKLDKDSFDGVNTKLREINDDLLQTQELYGSAKLALLSQWAGEAKKSGEETINTIEDSLKSCVEDFESLRQNLNDIFVTFEEADNLMAKNIASGKHTEKYPRR